MKLKHEHCLSLKAFAAANILFAIILYILQQNEISFYYFGLSLFLSTLYFLFMLVPAILASAFINPLTSKKLTILITVIAVLPQFFDFFSSSSSNLMYYMEGDRILILNGKYTLDGYLNLLERFIHHFIAGLFAAIVYVKIIIKQSKTKSTG